MFTRLERFSELTIPAITLIAFSLILFEWILLAIQHKVERNREGWVSVFSAGLAFSPIFVLTELLLVGFMFWLYQFRVFELGFQWYVWLIAWVVYDFLFWLIHFLSHKIRILWCLHNVHHTAKEMKLSVAFRGSLFDFLLVPHNFVWIVLLGIHPSIVLIVDAMGRFYGIIVHVNEKWFPDKKRNWIENFLVTPSAHRVHHAANHIYLDRNYGETFSVWDRIFGTYQVEIASESPRYGILKEVNSEDLSDAQFNEIKSLWSDIKSAEQFSDKLKYALMPPGWNHKDGGTIAHTLRAAALQNLSR